MKEHMAMIEGVNVKLNKTQATIQEQGESLVRKLGFLKGHTSNERSINLVAPYFFEIHDLITRVVSEHPTTISRTKVLTNLKKGVLKELGYNHFVMQYLISRETELTHVS